MTFNKDTVRSVIFEADTPAGKAFDVWLIVLILLSVLAVMADSVDSIHERYGTALYIAEWVFTILFTLEYLLRLHQALGEIGGGDPHVEALVELTRRARA